MNSGTIWVRFVEKTRGQKSRATVPLMMKLTMLRAEGEKPKALEGNSAGVFILELGTVTNIYYVSALNNNIVTMLTFSQS
jgi:hypothetical protein